MGRRLVLRESSTEVTPLDAGAAGRRLPRRPSSEEVKEGLVLGRLSSLLLTTATAALPEAVELLPLVVGLTLGRLTSPPAVALPLTALPAAATAEGVGRVEDRRSSAGLLLLLTWALLARRMLPDSPTKADPEADKAGVSTGRLTLLFSSEATFLVAWNAFLTLPDAALLAIIAFSLGAFSSNETAAA